MTEDMTTNNLRGLDIAFHQQVGEAALQFVTATPDLTSWEQLSVIATVCLDLLWKTMKPLGASEDEFASYLREAGRLIARGEHHLGEGPAS